MPSTTSVFGAAVLAFSGMSAAMHLNGTSPYGNSTAAMSSGVAMSTLGRPSATGTGAMPMATSNNTLIRGDSLFCPNLNGEIYRDGNSVSYIIQCDTNHFGITIDINIASRKRQAVLAPASIADCMAVCDTNNACVGTAYNTVAQTCTYFSEVGAAYAQAGVDFAIRVSDAAASTVSAGAEMTSTIYSTTVRTVSACAPTVTNCPLTAGPVVVTQVVPVSSTVYLCPAQTTVAASPIACSACAYGASTMALYSTSVVTISSCAPTVTNCPLSSSATVVSVGSTVVNYPSPSATVVATTTCAGCNSGNKASATTSGLVAFTGAADHVKAGMGMAAVMVGAAFMI